MLGIGHRTDRQLMWDAGFKHLPDNSSVVQSENIKILIPTTWIGLNRRSPENGG